MDRHRLFLLCWITTVTLLGTRQLGAADELLRVRVLSYNIHRGEGHLVVMIC